MQIDMKSLLAEIGVRPSMGKHARAGWINLPCPFCSGHQGEHLGWSLEGGYFHCWRCGYHPVISVISNLTGKRFHEAKKLVESFSDDLVILPHKKEIVHPDTITLPRGTRKFTDRHEEYLRKRGLDPHEVATVWGGLGTCAVSDLPWRIVIPIFFHNHVISWQTRDITGQAEIPYRACPERLEILPHKDLIYGLDRVVNRKAVVTEGVFDVWKLGPGAVGVFGIAVRKKQVLTLADHLDTAYILFDPESQARERAEQLCYQLDKIITSCFMVAWEWEAEDPGDLTRSEANKLMVELLGKR